MSDFPRITAAVAWGLLPEPEGWTQELVNERIALIRRIRTELNPHNLWLDHTTYLRYELRYMSWSDRHLVMSGSLQHCCQRAMEVILEGKEDAA